MDIVVGIDGSPASDAALEWAVDEARAHGGRVVALLAYAYLDQPKRDGGSGFDPDYTPDDAAAFLAEVVGRVAGDTDVDVEQRVVTDLPARALLHAAEGADLVVVGSRGRGGFKGLLLGSVSQQVVTHTRCPVVVVRPPSIDD